MSDSAWHVVLIQNAGGYVGPCLARRLAGDGCDLVLHGPQPALVQELRTSGTEVEVVPPVPASDAGSLLTAEGWQTLVDRAVDRFGRLDAAAISPPAGGSGRAPRGRFLDAGLEELRPLYGYLDSTFHALHVLVDTMRRSGRGGQILVFTSDAGAWPEAGWSLYGSIRAAQNFFVQAVALEHAADGICINAIGSKNAVFEGFPGVPPGAATDSSVQLGDWATAQLAETPLGRLGTMEELAEFTHVLLNGRNRFQTANYFSFSGGWHAL